MARASIKRVVVLELSESEAVELYTMLEADRDAYEPTKSMHEALTGLAIDYSEADVSAIHIERLGVE